MTILLSKKQVMEEYGLGRHLLDKAMARKEISYIKLERRVLFRREHIEEYLARNTVQAVSKDLEKKIKRRIKKRGNPKTEPLSEPQTVSGTNDSI